jgi:hypothetical protein
VVEVEVSNTWMAHGRAVELASGVVEGRPGRRRLLDVVGVDRAAHCQEERERWRRDAQYCSGCGLSRWRTCTGGPLRPRPWGALADAVENLALPIHNAELVRKLLRGASDDLALRRSSPHRVLDDGGRALREAVRMHDLGRADLSLAK